MSTGHPETLHYKRSHFATQLPVSFLYSRSHGWAAPQPDGTWRVGLTKFAVRMLGEMVDHGFEIEPHTPIASGQIIGWIEGFKAISDVYCIIDGSFLETNPLLKERISVLNKDPYRQGWIYAARGRPDATCMEVHAYRDLLDKTIDRILEKQKHEESPPAG